MNYSGVNNEQFIIMPGGTESAAVQTHETFYIAPITHITHLSDLHLNHRGEKMEVKCSFFKTLGIHLKLYIWFQAEHTSV